MHRQPAQPMIHIDMKSLRPSLARLAAIACAVGMTLLARPAPLMAAGPASGFGSLTMSPTSASADDAAFGVTAILTPALRRPVRHSGVEIR